MQGDPQNYRTGSVGQEIAAKKSKEGYARPSLDFLFVCVLPCGGEKAAELGGVFCGDDGGYGGALLRVFDGAFGDERAERRVFGRERIGDEQLRKDEPLFERREDALF